MDDRINERAELDALLKRLFELDGIMPGLIVHDDKPDFRITMPNRIIGVETTRLNYQEQFRAQKLHTSEFPRSWANLTGLKDHQPRRSNEKIIESVNRHPTDPSIASKKSCEVMSDWKDRVEAILERKRQKFNQSDYQIFDENWLLIHHGPPSQIDVYTQSLAQQHLNVIFNKPAKVNRDFDVIFIHSGGFLFRWRERKLSAWSNTTLMSQ
jgi:hypothetical protein